jgi:hypothetical protein
VCHVHFFLFLYVATQDYRRICCVSWFLHALFCMSPVLLCIFQETILSQLYIACVIILIFCFEYCVTYSYDCVMDCCRCSLFFSLSLSLSLFLLCSCLYLSRKLRPMCVPQDVFNWSHFFMCSSQFFHFHLLTIPMCLKSFLKS